MTGSENKIEKSHRLHKYSPLFILIHMAIKSIIPIIFGLYQSERWNYGVYVFAAIGVLITLVAVLQYWFYHYWLT